jgi:hypothetical protein
LGQRLSAEAIAVAFKFYVKEKDKAHLYQLGKKTGIGGNSSENLRNSDFVWNF